MNTNTNTNIRLGRGRTAPTSAIAPIGERNDRVVSSKIDVPVAALAVWGFGLVAFAALDNAGLPRDEPLQYLTRIAADPERYRWANIAYLAGAAALLPATVAIRRLVGDRPAGRIGSWMLALGGLIAVLMAGAKLTVRELVTGPEGVTPAAVAAYTRFQEGSSFTLVTLPLVVGLVLGTILTTVALWRSAAVPRVVPAGVFAGVVLGSGEFPHAVTVIGHALAAAAWAGAAWTLVARRTSVS